MIGLVLGDLAKLWRPLMLWLSLGVAALIVTTAVISQESAALQWRIATDNLVLLQRSPPPPEGFGLKSAGPEYQKALRQSMADAHAFIESTRQEVAMVGATQHPVGAAGLALGHMCSLIGALFLLLAAGGHVAGEWQTRTIKDVLVAEGRRARFVLAKSMTIWIVAVWFLLLSWAAVVVWGLVSQRVYPIAHPASMTAALDWTLPRLESAPLILAFMSVAAVFVAVLVRSGLGTVLGGTMTLTVFNVATRSATVEHFSPAAWFASLMDFQRSPFLIDHIWAEKALTVAASSSVVELVVFTGALAAAAVVLMRKRDVLF
jgi:ABC-type transport system involved in multi-copper enzyme maturation permease subunit